MTTGVSVYEMQRTVGRAKLAEIGGNSYTVEKILHELKAMSPDELIEAYHTAIVVLSQKNLLSQGERARMADYAKDWIASQPMGV